MATEKTTVTAPKTKPKVKRKKLPPGTPRSSKDKRAVIEAGEKLSAVVRSPGKKNPHPKTDPEIPVDSEPVGDGLTLRQDAFCHHYVLNDHLRGNGVFAYAEAYGIDLKSMPCDDYEFDPLIEGKILKKSTYQRAYHACGVNASQLLKTTKIQEKVNKLKASLINPEYLDRKLVDVIERGEPQHMVAAIREANRVLGRSSDTMKYVGIPNVPAVVQIQVIQPPNAGIDANPAGETPARA